MSSTQIPDNQIIDSEPKIISPQTLGGYTDANTFTKVIPKSNPFIFTKYRVLIFVAIAVVVFIALGVSAFFYVKKNTVVPQTVEPTEEKHVFSYSVDKPNYSFEYMYDKGLLFEGDAFYFSPFLKNIYGGYFKVYELGNTEDFAKIYDLNPPTINTEVVAPLTAIVDGERSFTQDKRTSIVYTKLYVYSNSVANIIFEFSIEKDNKYKDDYLKLFDVSATSFRFTKGLGAEPVVTQESTPSQ